MRVCWPTDKAILDPATGSHVHLPAGAPFEMPDEEAQDRIRQGDCARYAEPDASDDEEVETGDADTAPVSARRRRGALTGQQIQEG